MSIPQPSIELEGHCSAIYDNTLYVLSPNGFQSLPLTKHAQWSKETSGVPVTGPACVTVTPGGDESQAALWVIGGTSENDSYMGLQTYSFAQKSWQTLDTAVPVMQGRTNHSAAYLEDSQSIVVYAGSQQNAPSWLSSQTFLVSTQSPYTIQSFVSEAPPTNQPLLEAFNTSHAVMLGGSSLNTEIYLFNPDQGWVDSGTGLTSPLDSSSRGIIIDGDDGSKVMNLYDFSLSPNNVAQIVLLGAGGVPAYTGQTVNSSSGMRRKRGLSLNNWPTYNNKYAPSPTRADCSVALSSNGVVAIAGGSSAVPVALFNQNENSWIDASTFFSSKDQQPLKPTTSHTSTPTATPTQSSTPSATTSSASSGTTAHDRTLRTLGITLGVLCGIAVLFVLILVYLRWRKLRQRKQEGYIDEKENGNGRMSFADRGASFMKEAGGSVNDIPPPQSKPWNMSNNGSHSSLAIITGKFSNKRVSNVAHAQKASYDSTARLVKKEEPLELMNIEKSMLEQRMTPRTEQMPGAAQYGPTLTEQDASRDGKERRKRSSGWSRYFATSTPTGPNGLSHLPSAYGNGKRPPVVSDASAYSNERAISQHSRIPSSAIVPALDLEFGKTFDGQRLSHVAMGSPSLNDSREDLALRGSGLRPAAQKGVIVDPGRRRSQTDSISSYNRSTMSSQATSDYFHESGAHPWEPTEASFKDHLNSRPPSDAFFEQRDRLPSRGKSAGFFPGSGNSYRPPRSPKVKMTYEAAPTSDWAAPKAKSGPGHILAQQAQPAQDRDSNVTVFPRGVPSAYYADRRKEQDPPQPLKPVNSDLAWLNLGLSSPNQNRL